jgi:hypothetical protein
MLVDINGDGNVDNFDIDPSANILTTNWGRQPSTLPEKE